MAFSPKNAGKETHRPDIVCEFAISVQWDGLKAVPYNHQQHKFYFKWPHCVQLPNTVVNASGNPCMYGVAAFNVAFAFRQRMKALKGNGWHNSGPIMEKRCFLFSKKRDDGSGANKQISIALSWDGNVFIWVNSPNGNEDITEQLMNMIEMINY